MNDLAMAGFAETKPMSDSPEAAVSGILNAMLKMSPGTSRGQQRTLLGQLEDHFHLDPEEALGLAVLGNWIASQTETPAEALTTLVGELGAMASPKAQTALADLDHMADALFGQNGTVVHDRIQALLH